MKRVVTNIEWYHIEGKLGETKVGDARQGRVDTGRIDNTRLCGANTSQANELVLYGYPGGNGSMER